MAAASSSSGRVWTYDVFLNFRGDDTRKIFVSHLHKALGRKTLNAFIDAEDLRKGDKLSELLTSIQESRLSVVVFSEDYSSSSWCLKELVKILECMDTQNQIVVPIFYQVDPSHVRKLKRSSDQEAFRKHEHDSSTDMEEIQSWRSALEKAAKLSGWDSRGQENDAVFIEKIVDDIYYKLTHSSYKANGLVGMDFHVDKMKFLLCPKVNDVRVVGIWGMGGIGKTTIAKAVYDEIACEFNACCFLENVKEGFTKQGAVYMLTQLLSSVLLEKGPSFVTSCRGSNRIMNSLGSKKVLLVLDDVDNLDQIETLLGTEPSFGGGSRIIITTRDRELLSGIDVIYRPEHLTSHGALELFKQYAFRTKKPIADYRLLSRRAIEYARGLPLALKVLGAFLDNKNVSEWEALMEKTKNIPHMGIQHVLKTSFDGLDDSEKEIFLDIACFFKGMKKDYATKVLDSCGFFPNVGLRVLVDRALVIISPDDTLEMHDSLVEMGREIVRQESIKEPGRRSRLWSYEDIHHVLTQNAATKAIESITLDLSNSNEVCLNIEAFAKMKNLRLLNIKYCNRSIGSDENGYSHDDLKFLSHKLSCLLWHRCPLNSFPPNFYPKNLVDLDMQYSHITQLWEGTKPLKKLESINLSHCQYLKETPDFAEAENLKKLILDGCTSLFKVHASISALKNLVVLSLKGCKELRIFPSSICMKSLKTLNLSDCSNLQMFPEIPELMEELSELCADKTAIKKIPSSIENLTGLVIFNLEGCRELESFPTSIHMRSLESLNLSGCSKFKKFPDIPKVMEKLSELYLDGTGIKELPSSIKNLSRLGTLNLEGCTELERLPGCIHQMKSLKLTLFGCTNLWKVSNS